MTNSHKRLVDTFCRSRGAKNTRDAENPARTVSPFLEQVCPCAKIGEIPERGSPEPGMRSVPYSCSKSCSGIQNIAVLFQNMVRENLVLFQVLVRNPVPDIAVPFHILVPGSGSESGSESRILARFSVTPLIRKHIFGKNKFERQVTHAVVRIRKKNYPTIFSADTENREDRKQCFRSFRSFRRVYSETPKLSIQGFR